MRRLLCFIMSLVVVGLVGTSCENKSITSKLDDLDTLIHVCPDSVYAVLDSMDTQQMSRSQRMRHALLHADAQNKAYIDFTTDSVMLDVVDYYDKHGTPNEQMRAHYLLGCTYRDLNDVPMELQCFQEAVEKADTTSKDCDLYTLYAIYGQMANLYHGQYLPEEELKALENCKKVAILDRDTLSAISAYALKIRAYEILNNKDSILSITKNAFYKYQDLGEPNLAALLLGSAINIHIVSHEFNKAKHYINFFKQNSQSYDYKNDTLINHSIILYDLGLLSLHDKDYNSANKCFRNLLDINEFEAGYKGLLELYQELNNSDSIAKYAKLYSSANNTSFINKNSEVIVQMTAMYDYTRQQHIAKQKTIESAYTRNLVYIISMLAILLFFASLILYGYLKYKSKERERVYLLQEKTLIKRYNETKEIIAKLEQEKSYLETQKEEVSAVNKTHIERLLLTIDSYEKEKKELVLKLKGFNQISEDIDFKAWYEDFIACDATNRLHAKTIVTPNMVVMIDNKIWDELRAQINKYCPAFLNIIDSYSLNPTYQHIVLLNIFDFSTSEISILLNKTVQQISNNHNRISKKLFPSSNETRKLKQNLLKILRDKRV